MTGFFVKNEEYDLIYGNYLNKMWKILNYF